MMSLLNIFRSKLPKDEIVWCIGIPYSEEQFSHCYSKEDGSDFIESLEFKYATNDKDTLWKRYQSTANKIRECVNFLSGKGVTIMNVYSLSDLANVFTHSVIIITAHRHRYLDSFDFMGNAISFSDVADLIPSNYCGTIDVSSCHSASFQMQWKKKKINAKYIAASTESSIDLRLFIYEHVIRYILSHPGKSYLQSLEVILNRIQHSANEKVPKREDVFLGGNNPVEKHGEISASAFAPAETTIGDDMMIQVYIYEDKEHDNVVISAGNADEGTAERDCIPLNLNLKCDDKVKIQLNLLHCPELTQLKSLIWQGRTAKSYFNVTLPQNFDKKKCFVEIIISVNDLPLGELSFTTKVVNAYSFEKVVTDVFPKQYKKVFMSYAHQDIEKVRPYAHAYKVEKRDYFFDRDSLVIGDVYEEKILDYINTSDLFLLFWSEHAAVSDYVKKEFLAALKRAYPQVPFNDARLRICPMSIEPHAVLPVELKNIYNFEKI